MKAIDGAANRKARIRRQCKKTAVLSYQRFLINSGVETVFRVCLKKSCLWQYFLNVFVPEIKDFINVIVMIN